MTLYDLIEKIINLIGIDINQCEFKKVIALQSMKIVNINVLFDDKIIINLFIELNNVKKFKIENIKDIKLNFNKGFVLNVNIDRTFIFDIDKTLIDYDFNKIYLDFLEDYKEYFKKIIKQKDNVVSIILSLINNSLEIDIEILENNYNKYFYFYFGNPSFISKKINKIKNDFEIDIEPTKEIKEEFIEIFI